MGYDEGEQGEVVHGLGNPRAADAVKQSTSDEAVRMCMDLQTPPNNRETQTVAACPACQGAALSAFIGTQTWPQAVAERLNMPTTVEIWQCQRCQTTITVAPGDPVAPTGDCRQ